MIALWILCGILALALLALLLKLAVRIEYCGGLYLTISVGFIHVTRGVSKKKTDAEEPEQPPEEHKKNEKKKKKKSDTDVSLKELLPLARDTVADVFEKTKKHVKLERYILKINVATGDPASTGVLYGAVCAAAGPLLALALSARRKTRKAGAIFTEITPDFISDKPDIMLDIKFSTRVWRGLCMTMPLIKGYKNYRKLKKKKEKQNERHSAQTDN
ncbi:MAG: DUF2953 domain-containing protein [Clostridia bacterium]|nr:DUF2953 domain-containing protein [Clostridia bacterium]